MIDIKKTEERLQAARESWRDVRAHLSAMPYALDIDLDAVGFALDDLGVLVKRYKYDLKGLGEALAAREAQAADWQRLIERMDAYLAGNHSRQEPLHPADSLGCP